MIRYIKNEPYENKAVGGACQINYMVEIACHSTDTKPTKNIVTGSICLEADTGKIYAFDESTGDWEEIGSSGGGGGGGSGDYSTAKATIVVSNGNVDGYFPCITEVQSEYYIMLSNFGEGPGTYNYDVPVYKGGTGMEMSYKSGTTPTLVGSVAEVQTGLFIVSGDCSITLEGETFG